METFAANGNYANFHGTANPDMPRALHDPAIAKIASLKSQVTMISRVQTLKYQKAKSSESRSARQLQPCTSSGHRQDASNKRKTQIFATTAGDSWMLEQF